MSTGVPPKKNAIFTFRVGLVQQADTKLLQSNPTIAAGDVQVSTDAGAFANLATLPVVSPASSRSVLVTLSAAEMNGDDIAVVFVDAAGAQWSDLFIHIKTSTRQVDDLAFPLTSGRGLNVEADNMVHADLKEWLGVAPLALIAQRVSASVGAMAADVLTAAAIALDAIGSSEFAASAVDKIVNAVHDELTSEARVAGSYGQLHKDNLNAAITSRLAPTTAGRTLDILATGEAAANLLLWLGAAPVALQSGTVKSDVDFWNGVGVNPLITGNVPANVAVIQATPAQTIRDEILPTQNVAFSNIMFLLVAASDHVTPVTGATGLAVTRSIDAAAFTAGTGTLAEVANGIYQYDASAADMNGGIITFRFVATGGTPGAPDDRFVTIVTGGGV